MKQNIHYKLEYFNPAKSKNIQRVKPSAVSYVALKLSLIKRFCCISRTFPFSLYLCLGLVKSKKEKKTFETKIYHQEKLFSYFLVFPFLFHFLFFSALLRLLKLSKEKLFCCQKKINITGIVYKCVLKESWKSVKHLDTSFRLSIPLNSEFFHFLRVFTSKQKEAEIWFREISWISQFYLEAYGSTSGWNDWEKKLFERTIRNDRKKIVSFVMYFKPFYGFPP